MNFKLQHNLHPTEEVYDSIERKNAAEIDSFAESLENVGFLQEDSDYSLGTKQVNKARGCVPIL